MRLRRGLPAVLIAAVSLALPAGPAAAATTQIGAVAEISAGLPPSPETAADGVPFWAVQVGEATGTYAVPAGYGVITAWRHRAGTTPGDVTFKVYRATGNPGEFLVLAADTQSITPGAVQTFAVRIPVSPGDRIGISSSTAEVGYLCEGQLEVGMCTNPADQANRAGVFNFEAPDPPPATRATLDGLPFEGLRLDVSARVETDADRDGFGDDTQDGCPARAASQVACPRTAPYPLPPSMLPAFFGCPGSATTVIRGTIRPDTLTGTVRGDRIFTGTGADRVDALAGDDCVDLGTGADRGQGGPGADLLLGGLGNDRLTGQDGGDRLSGSSGRDRLNGGSGRDAISGGNSGDRIAGASGNDRANGSPGNDLIRGDSGADRLTGGTGSDRISGGAGNDRITARDGRRDRITCGGGRDRVSADRVDRVARDCERVAR